MKKLIIIFILGIFLILPLVSSLEASLPMVCGGDEQLIIMCGPADEELTFLSQNITPTLHGGPGGGGGAILDIEEPVEPEVEEPEEKRGIKTSIFTIFGLGDVVIPYWIIIIITLFGLLIFFFIYKKKKKEKEEKKKKKLEESKSK